MNYRQDDIKKFAELIIGKSDEIIPKCVCITEADIYEFSYDFGIDTTMLDESEFMEVTLTNYLCKLAEMDKFVDFLYYYFNNFLEKHIIEVSEKGYNLFILKDRLLSALNSAWSIPEQEFCVTNSKCFIKNVRFTLFNKIGEGGFCTVYKCPQDNSRVFKVLNDVEKADIGSIHRFKREFDIMYEQNKSGYTIKVYDYDSVNLEYAMDRAKISLEDYIEQSILNDQEKDEIIIRLADSMGYLHSHGIIHRDFHPGNILQMNDGTWMITDFGLAKELSSKYSYKTTTTHVVGRAWFTDPNQLFALKDGNYKTDMFSLAKTIDYIMNGNMSGESHKYSAVVYKATAPNSDDRYNNIEEMYADIESIVKSPIYESAEEIVKKLITEYNRKSSLDYVKIMSLLNNDFEGTLMINLILKMENDMVNPFCKISRVAFNVALREISRVEDTIIHDSFSWDAYDTVAYWAIGVIEEQNKNDEVCIKAAYIIEYVASSVGRFKIKKESNRLKNDISIDGHIRAKLTYHDGY